MLTLVNTMQLETKFLRLRSGANVPRTATGEIRRPIRGVSKTETLTLRSTRGTQGGEVKGQMAFDRKEYGMTSGIPLIKIADRVEVNVHLTAKRTGTGVKTIAW